MKQKNKVNTRKRENAEIKAITSHLKSYEIKELELMGREQMKEKIWEYIFKADMRRRQESEFNLMYDSKNKHPYELIEDIKELNKQKQIEKELDETKEKAMDRILKMDCYKDDKIVQHAFS